MQQPTLPGPPYGSWQYCSSPAQQIQQLQATLANQSLMLQELQSKVEQLTARLEAAEARPQYRIEKLEYKFDQLKIESLDGTLNIGITPPGEQELQDLCNQFGQVVAPCPVPGQQEAATSVSPVYPEASRPERETGPDSNNRQDRLACQQAEREIDHYLEHQAGDRLQQLAASYNIQVDPYHQRIVIEDIRKQMKERVHYYIQQCKSAGETASETDSTTASTTAGTTAEGELNPVVSKTIRDINQALEAYLANLIKK